jgi:hypothetical protein
MASNRHGEKGHAGKARARSSHEAVKRSDRLAQEVGDVSQAGVGLLIQAVAVQVPFDSNEEELVADLIAIARRSGGVVAPAQFGDFPQSHVLVQHVRHASLAGADDDREISPAAQFDYGSCGRHTLTRPLTPPFGKIIRALLPTIHRSRIESEAAT